MKTHAVQARGVQNWAKEVLHSTLLPSGEEGVALCEIYCGGAGLDVGKYDRARVKTYAAVDPSKEALKRTEKAIRLKGNPFRATYVPADPAQPSFSEVMRKTAGSAQFDAVVCYNGLHQKGRWGSERSATDLLRSVHTCLKPGGFFFGFVPDSATLWSRTQGADSETKSGPLYHLKCTPSASGRETVGDRQFGALDFRLQIKGEAAPEQGSLIHFYTFQRLAEQAGFRVLEIINLLEYYHMNKARYRKQLVAYQVVSQKQSSIDKANADVVASFAVFILQRKTDRDVDLERTQEGLLRLDELVPDAPVYMFAANAAHRKPSKG